MKLFLTFIVVFISIFSFSQREKFPSYFGVQIRPLFPTSFGGSKGIKLNGENYSLNLTQTLGYSFGGTIRKGITKLIAFESGLNFTQRNYNLTMSLTDTNVSVSDHFSFISYEIPINGLVYIQLGQKIFMNTSMGLALRFSPTDIKKTTETGGTHSFKNYGYYSNKIGLNINANIGFEYRTSKYGFFYFGGSICVPLNQIIDLKSIHSVSKQTHSTLLFGKVEGNYLSLDLKYFFPTIRTQGEQPLKGPIE
jgi:hypothetical protein